MRIVSNYADIISGNAVLGSSDNITRSSSSQKPSVMTGGRSQTRCTSSIGSAR